jgi:hypothetical protein
MTLFSDIGREVIILFSVLKMTFMNIKDALESWSEEMFIPWQGVLFFTCIFSFAIFGLLVSVNLIGFALIPFFILVILFPWFVCWAIYTLFKNIIFPSIFFIAQTVIISHRNATAEQAKRDALHIEDDTV